MPVLSPFFRNSAENCEPDQLMAVINGRVPRPNASIISPLCSALASNQAAISTLVGALALSRVRNAYSDNLIEVVEWCMALDPLSRPQSVFALQKELSREGERRYTKLSVAEKMRLQLDNLVSDTKKSVQKVGDATGVGAKPK